MRAALLIFTVTGSLCGTAWSAVALSPEQLGQLPPATLQTIDFKRDVHDLLEARCIQCHGRGKASGRFSLESRETTLAGGSSGPAVVLGRSEESYLIELVAGVDPDNVMPAKGTRLTPGEIGILRAWIDQGLAWEEDIGFERLPARNLTPHRPSLPGAGKGLEHPVDQLMGAYFESQGLRVPEVVSDRLFIRRATLDVTGLIPTPAEIEAFEADQTPDKRAGLVKRLLADRAGYAVHWLTFWNDALRNDYQGTGYIDGGRRQITEWLYGALVDNMPFDQFVRELVDPKPATAGFVNGIIWRGVVNASQTPEMQAAQNISQVFMGVNLKCASCHDSFINDWRLADAYGLAGVYANEPLEMVHCDKPMGEVAPLRFLYPELGEIEAAAPRSERLKQLAQIMTAEKNGRLPRTIVNRLWGKLMGRGLVEPVDDMEQPAWSPELLDWLATDLVDHRYDLKRTLELILTSHAYQLPAVRAPEQSEEKYAFRGPTIRRLTAEQFLDSLSMITGAWNVLPSARINYRQTQSAPDLSHSRAQWIWINPEASSSAPPQTVKWRRTFDLPRSPEAATIVVTCDNEFRLTVNGRHLASGKDFARPQLVDLSSALCAGKNVIAIEAVNAAARPGEPSSDQSNPAGLLAQLTARSNTSGHENLFELTTDHTWRWTLSDADGWTDVDFDDSAWQPAAELGGAASSPWNIADTWIAMTSMESWVGRARAALMVNDPLMTALGRPNREQVVTSRPSAATTLQALELTNGETMAKWLRQGAQQLLASSSATPRELISDLYRRALGRQPTLEETRLTSLILGTEPAPAEVEDLLWAMVMLPEFQLIH